MRPVGFHQFHVQPTKPQSFGYWALHLHDMCCLAQNKLLILQQSAILNQKSKSAKQSCIFHSPERTKHCSYQALDGLVSALRHVAYKYMMRDRQISFDVLQCSSICTVLSSPKPVADPGGGERWPGPPQRSATPNAMQRWPVACIR